VGFFDFLNPPAANIQLPQFMAPQVTYPTQTTQAPGGTAQIGQTAAGSIPGLSNYNYWGSLYPQASGIAQGMVGDPSAMGYLNAAYGGGALGQGGALNAYGAGANLYGLGGPTIQTAFDPQQDLYNRTFNQMSQQAQAGLASSGLLNTPWGQGVLGQDISNFNIDWQNTQQGRQLAGLNALNQMYPTAANLQAGASPLYAQAGGLPWTTGQQIGGAGLNTLQGLAGFGAQGAQIPQQQFQNYLSYLGWATPAEQQAFNQAQTTGYADPMGYAAAINQGRQNTFQDALAQSVLASQQQGQMFGGLGRIAGGIGGFALGGLPGAMVGSSLFGGGGGGGFPSGGGSWGGMNTSPFGGMFGSNTFGGQANLLPQGWGTIGRQFGGDVQPGQEYMVGEAGPEKVRFNQPGTIIPNPATQAMGGGDHDMPSGPFMPGMPGSHGPGSPYPMGMPFEGQLAGIGAFGKGFQRPGGSGMGWQYGGGFG
jgi:hypothetical protein